MVEKIIEAPKEKIVETPKKEAKEIVEKPKDTLKGTSEKPKEEVVVEKKAYVPKGKFGRKKRFEAEPIIWVPKTKLGIEVHSGKIKNIDEILDNNMKILEPEIVDHLLEIQSDLISIGQSKGKFGGGKRRAWRQTQRKTKEGNVPTFSAMAVVGNENGYVGIGTGKSMETLPARDKSMKKAKLNLIKVKRGCSAFDCSCDEPHTVPFEVTGKSGSVRVTLIPAPQGTGLVVGDQLKKLLKLSGIKDVYSKTFGSKKTTFNFVKACFDALKKTNVGGIK